MKFLVLVKSSEKYRADTPPAALMEAMDAFIKEGFASGTLVDTGGLKPSAAAVRFRIEKGKLATTDGPFTEAKEVVGGWAILKMDSRADAIASSRKFMELHSRHWPSWEGTSEMFEMEDYG